MSHPNETSTNTPRALTCLNCDTRLSGPFCAQCGQKAGDLHVTLRAFLAEALDSLFSFDSRFWRSLRPLLLRPGQLTLEYWQGRRMRYLPPLRLYLFVSFITFLATGMFAGQELVDTSGNQDSRAMVQISFSAPAGDDPTQAEAIDWEAESANQPAVIRWLMLHVVAPTVEQPERTTALFAQRLPWAVFVMVPFFAALLRLLYRSRERYFVPHLVFALHFHSAFFILFAVGKLGDRLGGTGVVSLAAALTATIYLFLALRRAFHSGVLATLTKELVLLSAYVVVLGVVLFLLLGLTAFSL